MAVKQLIGKPVPEQFQRGDVVQIRYIAALEEQLTSRIGVVMSVRWPYEVPGIPRGGVSVKVLNKLGSTRLFFAFDEVDHVPNEGPMLPYT